MPPPMKLLMDEISRLMKHQTKHTNSPPELKDHDKKTRSMIEMRHEKGKRREDEEF